MPRDYGQGLSLVPILSDYQALAAKAAKPASLDFRHELRAQWKREQSGIMAQTPQEFSTALHIFHK
jgi:hypothetical protein